MKNLFVPNPRTSIIRGILTITIGSILLFVPGLTMRTVMIIIGAMLLLSGVITMILSNRKRSGSMSGLFSIQGIVNVLFGIVFIASPTVMVEIFVFLLGIILLVMGLFQFIGALGALSRSSVAWVYLLIAILTLASGVFLLTDSLKSAEAILKFLGVILIMNGISELFMAGKIRRQPKIYKGSPIHDVPYEEV
jgi:uncharacterized membrane protein HdeD (DUF308 family)